MVIRCSSWPRRVGPVRLPGAYAGRNGAAAFAAPVRAGLLALLFCAGMGGCFGGAALPPDTGSLLLEGVPFHPQARWQCGPAALATVLGASGLDVTPEALVPQVWIPGRHGTLAAELLAATRRADRIPWRPEPNLAGLLAELARGRPVLVFQNLGIEAIPRWHYAVVVGVDPERGEILLRSGRERLRRTPVALFDRTWARSGRWAMVALRAGEQPASAEPSRWFETLTELEEAGRDALAHDAWNAWLVEHPDDAVARFGRAATAARLGDLAAAAADYEDLLTEHGADVRVLNNLAEVRSRQGCRGAALELIEQALSLAGPGEAAVVEDTRTALAARAASACPAAPDVRIP